MAKAAVQWLYSGFCIGVCLMNISLSSSRHQENDPVIPPALPGNQSPPHVAAVSTPFAEVYNKVLPAVWSVPYSAQSSGATGSPHFAAYCPESIAVPGRSGRLLRDVSFLHSLCIFLSSFNGQKKYPVVIL
ncbi:hypothetical protein HMPREF9447_01715 [Bacteroides oleiciplenus YIT 12058]|uniref:Uncharacterized protein n=1 Tax=Bacteroides oleiciplenus YIT 12058 TaxID=742727 RepID=K9EH75_9BACE|nr:hypothetical protein HMPREF9447_01715 [Bacteroides oleiciplenus YIT 12058]